jgi:hypothetical protein
MKMIAAPLTLLIIAFVCLLCADAGYAQTRVFVAAQGSDSNPCTFASPCRTFQRAHNVVPAGGEINVLDPAGYGPLIITKAISIQGHDFSGISVPSGGTGITINAGANDNINLRGLIIEGGGGGQHGIVFNTGAGLTVQNSVVRNFTGIGIAFFPSLGAVDATLTLSDTFVSNNGDTGIYAAALPGTVLAVFNRVHVDKNLNGLFLQTGQGRGPVIATATDCIASANVNVGFGIQNLELGGPQFVDLSLVRSVAANNGTGLSALGMNVNMFVAGTAISENVDGMIGAVLSFGDNKVYRNGNNETFSAVVPAK